MRVQLCEFQIASVKGAARCWRVKKEEMLWKAGEMDDDADLAFSSSKYMMAKDRLPWETLQVVR